jgi:hypothetical protein
VEPTERQKAWLAATQIDPRLVRLEAWIERRAGGKSLADVERWLKWFTLLMDEVPALEPHRRAIFGHLLVVHNGGQAVSG